MRKYWFPIVAVVLMVAGALLMLGSAFSWFPAREEVPPLPPVLTATPEPIVPTRTSEATRAALPVTEIPPEALPITPPGFVFSEADRFRFGISLPYGALSEDEESFTYGLAPLKVGWVMDWSVRARTSLPANVDYVQTVRTRATGLHPDAATLTTVAALRPGSTWLIGNEPDVRWQDNVTPEVYARLYHEAYTAIKSGDATAIVAAGGIAQASPLRLRYLERVLSTYRAEFGVPFPAQAWQIHNYILREERDSWGVDIPPGMPDTVGELYSIEDSGNMSVFRQQVMDFRRWMVQHGYAGLPLLITEFGVPMPPDYGFPPERMAEFLLETWQFFLTATDAELGASSDGGRLVQRWCWFSMAHPPYPTGNLIEMETGGWTPLGQAWIAYVGGGGE